MYNMLMNKKEMEKNLNYGDCNNIISVFGDIFETTCIKKDIDSKIKKD